MFVCLPHPAVSSLPLCVRCSVRCTVRDRNRGERTEFLFLKGLESVRSSYILGGISIRKDAGAGCRGKEDNRVEGRSAQATWRGQEAVRGPLGSQVMCEGWVRAVWTEWSGMARFK